MIKKLFRIFFSFCRRAASWGLLQMAGSVSFVSISFIWSAFLDNSKKPPEVGGLLLQFSEQTFNLNKFHARIVAVFTPAVKGLTPRPPRVVGWHNQMPRKTLAW
jgi:hypothetical protein